MHEDWIGLASRARDGDLRAFERLVERFKRPICAAIHPIVKDWHLTQDVAQEAFAAAFRQLKDLREPMHFRAYLYRIARNRAVSRVRSIVATRALSIHGLPEEDIQALPLRPSCRLATGEPRPSEAALRRVRRVVMELPHEYGTLLMMRYVEGMSTREMARVLDRTPKAVKAVLYRARIKARTALRKAGLELERILDEM